MNIYLVFLNIAGAVTLLLWAVRMVRTGIERGYMPTLRRLVGQNAKGFAKAATVGGVAAIALQSSTAAAMITTSFAARGAVTLPIGLAMLLGADLGSALVVQILGVMPQWIMPALIIGGAALFHRGRSQAATQMGRSLIGIALILVSLQLIGQATAPLREASGLPQIIAYLAADPITALLLGAIFTWIVHSSVASVLLVAAFAAQGLIPFELGCSLVLGANVGGGVIAFVLSRSSLTAANRITLGNLIFRSAFALFGLAALSLYPLPAQYLGPDAAHRIMNFHLLFNGLMLLLALPLVRPMSWLMTWLIKPAPGDAELAGPAPFRLDDSLLDAPTLALASAKRALLQMAEIVGQMLEPVMELYETAEPDRIRRIKQMEIAVNAAQSELKLYLSRIRYPTLNGPEAKRGQEMAQFAINLEHVGDAIVKTLLKLAKTRSEQQLKFSAAGWRELNDLHHRVLENLELALNVLMSEDRTSAELLLARKEALGDAGRASATEHLVRLSEGRNKSISTSNIHLETIRALKTINSHLSSIAYAVLNNSEEADARKASANAG